MRQGGDRAFCHAGHFCFVAYVFAMWFVTIQVLLGDGWYTAFKTDKHVRGGHEMSINLFHYRKIYQVRDLSPDAQSRLVTSVFVQSATSSPVSERPLWVQ